MKKMYSILYCTSIVPGYSTVLYVYILPGYIYTWYIYWMQVNNQHQLIKAQYRYGQHLGDNSLSDLLVARGVRSAIGAS